MDQREYSWKLPVLWGGALFSMFFGAGNMIYSLWLGYNLDSSNYWSGVIGFIVAAVIFPLIGLIGIWSQRGCVFSFLAPIHSRKLKVAILLLILAVWAPFGSMPRAILLTFKSLQPFLPEIPSPLAHLPLCMIVGYFVVSPQKMISIFGKWLTPGLLLAAAGLFIVSHLHEAPALVHSSSSSDMLFTSINWGYQTMDGLAAIFFGKLLVEMFANERLPKKIYRRFFTITFCTALIMLALVYLMLINAASRLTTEVEVSSPIVLMVELSRQALGPWVGGVVALLMAAAALSTAVALALITSDFIYVNTDKKVPRGMIVAALMTVTYFVSLLGIEGIHMISGPPLQILYPALLMLSIYLIVIHKPLTAFKEDAHILDETGR